MWYAGLQLVSARPGLMRSSLGIMSGGDGRTKSEVAWAAVEALDDTPFIKTKGVSP